MYYSPGDRYPHGTTTVPDIIACGFVQLHPQTASDQDAQDSPVTGPGTWRPRDLRKKVHPLGINCRSLPGTVRRFSLVQTLPVHVQKRVLRLVSCASKIFWVQPHLLPLYPLPSRRVTWTAVSLVYGTGLFVLFPVSLSLASTHRRALASTAG